MKDEYEIYKVDGLEYHFREYYIPTRMVPGIQRYVEEGIIPGDFLQAIICNDLSRAVGTADDENMRNIPAYVYFFYNNTPAGCWGSKEKMLEWSKLKKEKKC